MPEAKPSREAVARGRATRQVDGFSCTGAKRLRPRFRKHDGVVRVNAKCHCPRRRLDHELRNLGIKTVGLSGE